MSSSNAFKRVIFLGVVPLTAALFGGWLYLSGGRVVETENAYLKADKIPLSSQVAGQVRQVLVAENAEVRQGQVLYRLDDAPYQLALEQASAKLAQVQTELAALKASYAEKQAEISVARTKLAFAQKTFARQTDLARKNFVSATSLDDAKQALELARQQIVTLEQDLTRISESLGGDVELPFQQHPSYQAALAAKARAALDLSYIEITAPVDGVVSNLPKPGQFLAAGRSNATLVAKTLWIEANFTETDIAYMRQGQTVKIAIDRLPDMEFSGKVESFSPATGSEFAVIPPQNATGNWVKISQRVPVRIALDPITDSKVQQLLLTGLSAVVAVDTEHQRQVFGWILE